MKKTILFAITMAFGNICNAQSDGGGYDLTSVINPAHSRGYICWNSIPNAKYEVKLLQKDSLGNFYQVGKKTTTNNYARLEKSNYTDQSGLYYSIVAYETNNNSVITESDEQVYTPPNSYSNLICEVDCNGSNYSWNLQIREVNSYGNNVMSLKSAYAYFDAQDDEAVPYYVAMSLATYQELPQGHPYKYSGTDNTLAYKTISIPTIGGPFYTASGSTIAAGSPGYLIEKKMNQFEYMGNGITTGNPDPNVLCNGGEGNLTAMINYFNSYTNISQLQAPYSPGPFGIIPNQLECDGSGIGPGNSGPDLTPNFLNSTHNLVNNLVCEGLELCEYLLCIGIDCSDNTIGSINDIVSGLVIEQFNDNSQNYTFDLKSNTTNFSVLQNLPTGLYQITAFGNYGEIYPFYVEHINPDYRPQEKDYVNMTLLPTLIEDDQLNVSISSEIDVSATVQVQSLNGDIHYTEVVNLKSTIDKPLFVTINTSNIPYNQLKVNLIFSDGSLIQKTAVKVN